MFSALCSRFFGTKEVLSAVGPLAIDPAYPPQVIIRRGHESATISWNPNRLCAAPPAMHALRSRLQAAGFLEAVDTWIEHHGHEADPQPERQGTARYGQVLHVPLELADALAGLVVSYFSRAVATPLTLAEFTAHVPDWQPSQDFVSTFGDAASPDLLQACVNALEVLRVVNAPKTRQGIEAAIAKALASAPTIQAPR